jgi:hypothetical protein
MVLGKAAKARFFFLKSKAAFPKLKLGESLNFLTKYPGTPDPCGGLEPPAEK